MADSGETRLQHVVLFSFPEPLSEAEDGELRAIVAAWPPLIRTMSECRLGQDLTGNRNQEYQYLLYTVFPDTEALAAYQAHPAHQKLMAFLDAHQCKKLAFDYYLDNTTQFS